MQANRYNAGSAAYRIAMRSMLAAISSELRGKGIEAAGGGRTARQNFDATAKFHTQCRISPCCPTGGM